MAPPQRRAAHAPARFVALLLALVGLLLTPLPAFAEHLGSNVDPDTSNYETMSGNVYFVYVEEGEYLHTWGNGGSGWIYRPGETTPYVDGANTGGPTFSSPHLVSAEHAGVWTIRYGGASSWNVTAYDEDPGLVSGSDPLTQTPNPGADEIPGRVWVNQYLIRQSGAAAKAKNLEFWAVDDTGYEYALRLRGYSGVNSTIIANSLGLPTGETGTDACTPSYRSWEFDAVDQGEVTGTDETMSCANRFRLFFEEPAADLPASAPVQPTEYNNDLAVQTIKPPPLNPADVEVDGFTFAPTAPGAADGTFDYDLGAGFFGSHLLQVDTNGNGSFDDPVDRTIRVGAQGKPVSYDFDGVDGLGDPIASCTPMNARVYLDRVGEIHMVLSDVEGISGGIEMIRTNGQDSPDATIYWDDTQTGPKSNEITIPDPAAVADPRDGTAGVDSTDGTHAWDYSTRSWGDSKLIDNYTFQEVAEAKGTIGISGSCLELEKESSATHAPRVGETVTYTVTATNTGQEDFTAGDPAVVVDDFTALLDDATAPTDLTATVDGNPVAAPVVDGSRWVWTGPLAAGESVEVSYDVVVTAAGDGELDNVAFAPPPGGDPLTFPPPDCTIGSGFDPASGVYCATTENDLARLRVAKSADRTDVPAVGETVEYTVVGTSIGPGAYGADNPAVLIDDLTDVLDDADLVTGSPQASAPGDLVVEGDRIVWTGELGAGDEVELTYRVTYTGEGDHDLDNVAFGGLDGDDPLPDCDESAGADPATGVPCDITRVPGSGLTVEKTSRGGRATPGKEITYQLTFTNEGKAAATVDHVDHLAGVLDDARVGAPTASAGLTVSPITGDTFTVTGSVPPGGTETVTYVATVKRYAAQGDHVLVNFLLRPNEQVPPTCAATSVTCTHQPAPGRPRIKTRATDKRVKATVRKNGAIRAVRLRDRVRIRNFTPGGTARGTATLYGPVTKAGLKNACRPAKKVGTVRFRPRNGAFTTRAVRVTEPGYYTWRVVTTADDRNLRGKHRCGLPAETTLVHRPGYHPLDIDTGADDGREVRRDRARRPSVRIPAVGINAPMSDVGATKRAMRIPNNVSRVGWLRKSAAPGEVIGSTVIAGHVSDNRDRPGAFWRLKKVRRGQVVRVTGVDGTVQRYQVTRVFRQQRSKQLPRRLFDTRKRSQLVLVSCTGKVTYRNGRFHYTKNLVVVAKPIR